MNQKLINQISKTIYQKFPELNGSRPNVKQDVQAKSLQAVSKYVLTYKGITVDAGGRKFPRQVRVVADQEGEILRVSTSR